MKIRVQRIGRSEHYNQHQIDEKFMDATIVGGIRPGKELRFMFAHLDDGVWHTTKVVRIEYSGEKNLYVHTKNSIYAIRKGWRED